MSIDKKLLEMYASDQRIFGPLTKQPHFQGSPLQSGQGIGDWLKSIVQKVIPIAKRGLTKAFKSDIAKETGKKLLEHGLSASTTMIANAIDPKAKSHPIAEAQASLSNARADVAEIIRNNKRKSKKQKSINEDEFVESESAPAVLPKKRKRVKYQTKSKKKQPKRLYNLFEDVN